MDTAQKGVRRFRCQLSKSSAMALKIAFLQAGNFNQRAKQASFQWAIPVDRNDQALATIRHGKMW